MELTQTYTQAPGFFKRLSIVDWLYAAALLAGSLFALSRYGAFMDVYEKAILVLAAPPTRTRSPMNIASSAMATPCC